MACYNGGSLTASESGSGDTSDTLKLFVHCQCPQEFSGNMCEIGECLVNYYFMLVNTKEVSNLVARVNIITFDNYTPDFFEIEHWLKIVHHIVHVWSPMLEFLGKYNFEKGA